MAQTMKNGQHSHLHSENWILNWFVSFSIFWLRFKLSLWYFFYILFQKSLCLFQMVSCDQAHRWHIWKEKKMMNFFRRTVPLSGSAKMENIRRILTKYSTEFSLLCWRVVRGWVHEWAFVDEFPGWRVCELFFEFPLFSIEQLCSYPSNLSGFGMHIFEKWIQLSISWIGSFVRWLSLIETAPLPRQII